MWKGLVLSIGKGRRRLGVDPGLRDGTTLGRYWTVYAWICSDCCKAGQRFLNFLNKEKKIHKRKEGKIYVISFIELLVTGLSL